MTTRQHLALMFVTFCATLVISGPIINALHIDLSIPTRILITAVATLIASVAVKTDIE